MGSLVLYVISSCRPMQISTPESDSACHRYNDTSTVHEYLVQPTTRRIYFLSRKNITQKKTSNISPFLRPLYLTTNLWFLIKQLQSLLKKRTEKTPLVKINQIQNFRAIKILYWNHQEVSQYILISYIIYNIYHI